MNTLLPSLPLLTAFLAAAFVLAATPGPGVLYVVTRTLSQGRASGFSSVAGVALGNLGNAATARLAWQLCWLARQLCSRWSGTQAPHTSSTLVYKRYGKEALQRPLLPHKQVTGKF
jgi:hypothetical protein